jgi:hypothetical protein
MVAGMRLDMALYAHCLPCYFKDRTIIQLHREEREMMAGGEGPSSPKAPRPY